MMGRPPRSVGSPVQVDTAPVINTRAAAVQQERRRRNVNDRSSSMALGVDESKLDPHFVYRWINEEEGGRRLVGLTQHDDYNMVSAEDMGAQTDDLGSAMVRIVGALKDGSPNRAFLCRKRRDWYEADKQSEDDRRNETMKSIKRGRVAQTQGDETAADRDLAPSRAGISIRDKTAAFEP